MKVGGLVGIRGSGRTEIFDLLAAGAGFTASRGRVRQTVAQITPPDERLSVLARIVDADELTPAEFTIVDFEAVGFGESSERQAEWLNVVRTVDLLLVVIPAFLDGDDADAELDSRVDEISTELVIADLVVTESRLGRLDVDLQRAPRDTRSSLDRERELLQVAREVLSEGGHPRGMTLSESDRRLLAGFGFLTLKPVVALLNTDENAVASWEVWMQRLGTLWPYPNTAAAGLSAQVEREADQLDPGDRGDFLDAYGIPNSALARVCAAVYEATSTSTVYTWNEQQVQAWPVTQGATASEFAEMIHSDIARGFISAETIQLDDLVDAGSYAAARRQGLVRKEGRDYEVLDGDVVQVLFSR